MIHLAAVGALALGALADPIGSPAPASPATAGPAASLAPALGEPRVLIEPDGPAAAINPTGRQVVLTTPVMQGAAYLGDATMTLAADGRAFIAPSRLLALLEPMLSADALVRLRTATQGRDIGKAELQAAGVALRYNSQALQLELEIAGGSRRARTLTVGNGNPASVGTYVAPADFSAYLNMRGSFDWVQQGGDTGFNAPLLFLDGAARIRGVVLESELDWRPGGTGPDAQRRGTRLVYDDRDHLVRWAGGDLQPLARGFQSAPEIAGFSASRFYSVLEPQTIIRPRGNRSFRLDRRAVVEVRVNNQLVRRMDLEPGAYDLQDFPFTQGSNDVRLTITDEVGQVETMNFNLFLDQAQLAEGLSEFGFYAGVLSPLGFRGPQYSDTPAVSGFYRRGVSQWLTLGANGQADDRSWIAGAEAVVATPLGSFAGAGAGSDIEDIGRGWAGTLTFQRTIARRGNQVDALSLSVEGRSRNFAPIGIGTPFNPYRYTFGAGYSAAITETIYAGIDARHSLGRDEESDASNVRGTLGWNITPMLSLTSDVAYERDARGDRIGVFMSLVYRPSRGASVRADYDSRFDRGRLSYQAYGGSGAGAYALSADVERSTIGAGITANGTYYGNRAEVGFSHFGAFENDLGSSTSQRSSMRFGTAFAFADGAFAMGRPIYDAFAIVKAHPTLKGADVLVDPSGGSHFANTGALGMALQGSLPSYSERSILTTAPEAPISANLGAGSFRLMPPYRGGYALTVGSDYNVSAVGRLLDRQGAPLSLITGTASEIAKPGNEPLTLFTNSEGRFGLTGLAPGVWRIVMADPDSTAFDVVILRGANESVRLGDLKPAAR
jgi:outer membrane usher protein